MPRVQKLKVFRTPIGFHDAYVAAPSQKAALEAWGADSNLFATGGAERIEVPELMREPLAKPGQVVRRPRGTLAEHVAALPKKTTVKTGKTARAEPAEVSSQRIRRSTKPKPLPSRTALDRVEAALVELQQRQDAARVELAQRQAELDRARKTLEAKQERERGKLEERIAVARDKYDRSMRAWRAG